MNSDTLFDASAVSLPQLPATIHLVGIGGVGVSGLARILTSRGYTVTGSDMNDSPVVEALRQDGIPVMIGHSAANLGDASLVVTTAAARLDNPELLAAQEAGVPIIKRAALLGMLCNERVCVAVAGSHGKSTTSGMLAYTLSALNLNPSFAVGAVVDQLQTNAQAGDGTLFVTEADEYDYSFLWLKPEIAIVTNIEHDHPDLFPTEADIDAAFDQFVAGIKSGGTLVLGSDDAGCQRLLERLHRNDISISLVGRDESADWVIHDSNRTTAYIESPERERFPLDLQLAGRHNRTNAALALVAAASTAVAPSAFSRAVSQFSGVGRRFDKFGIADGVTVIDDYAHHPTELAATIAAARERYPDAAIHVLFQPHTYSRTHALLHEFAGALRSADHIALVDIYPARETDTLGVSSSLLAEQIPGDVAVYGEPQIAGRHLGSTVHSGDVILVLGAGDIWKASAEIIATLRRREES